MFGRSTFLGAATAEVRVDLSQPKQSVTQFKTISRQIRTALDEINRGIVDIEKAQQKATKASTQAAKVPRQPSNVPEFSDMIKREEREQKAAISRAQAVQRQFYEQEVQARQAKISRAQAVQQQVFQQERSAEQQRRQALATEVRITESTLAEMKGRLATQQGRFNVASPNAPATVDKSGVQTDLAAARQPLIELEARLKSLRTELARLSGNPEAQQRLINDFRALTQQALQAQAGIDRAANSVTRFTNQASAARRGLQGYFTQVREGLEKLNETSLAANLQEVSFRLLPLGLAAGAITKQGVEVAQTMEEIRINFTAFTGSEQEAVELMAELTEQAHRFGLPVLDTLSVMQRFAPIIRQSGLELDDMINIAVRLSTLNPAQGIEGALFALNEALAGQWRSVQNRFNLPTKELRDLITDKGFVGGFDEFLNRLGRTTELAEQFGKTSRASMQRLQDSWNSFLATAMQPTVDDLTNISNTLTSVIGQLQQASPALAQFVGGFVTLTTAAVSALVAISQIALGAAALKTLLPKTVRASIMARVSEVGALAGSERVGAVAAAGGTILTGVAALTIGAAIGQQLAAYMERRGVVAPGESDPSSLWLRLKQTIFLGVDAIITPFFIGASVIKNAIDAIGNAIDLIATTIASQVSKIQIAITVAIRQLGQDWNLDFLKNFGTDPSNLDFNSRSRFRVTRQDGQTTFVGAAGVQAGSSQFVDMNNELIRTDPYSTTNPIVDLQLIEGYTERIERLTNALKNPPSLESMVDDGIRTAQALMQGLFELAFPELIKPEAPRQARSRNGSMGGSLTSSLSEDQLEQAYNLLVQDMIQTTRQLEDEARQAAREVYDFNLQRSRAITDFNRQRALAEEDFLRDRQEQVDDYNRQLAETEEEAQKERVKQQRDFAREEQRRQEDHLRDMLRAARDVDDAISARDFLAAQKAIQKMRDDEEDFATEERRRQEDYQQQQTELQENLDEQNAKRREDFERQLKQMDENFARQRMREREEFILRLQREDQDRAERLRREEEDRQIANMRRQQDRNMQLAALMDHNGVMMAIWRNGLDGMRSYLANFWSEFNKSIAAEDRSPNDNTGRFGRGGQSSQRSQTSSSGFPTLTDLIGAAVPSYALGTMGLPADMLIKAHKDEIIIPPAESRAIRRGEMSIGGSGDIYVNIDAAGSAMNYGEWVRYAEDVIIPKVAETLREGKNAAKNRRGA